MSSSGRAARLGGSLLAALAVASCGTPAPSSTWGSSGASTGAGGAGGTSSGAGAATTTTSADGGNGTTTTTTDQKPPFSLDAHTSQTPGGALALTTNLPASTADCLAAPFSGTPCDDKDQDGLADAWEDL